MRLRQTLALLIAVAALALSACDTEETYRGEFEATLSGALTGSAEGVARYRDGVDVASILTLVDERPRGTRIFRRLDFELTTQSGPLRIGAYPVVDLSADVSAVGLSATASGADLPGTFLHSRSGEVVIERADAGGLRGRFRVELSPSGAPADLTEIEGTFTAVPR
jgi:hypothetical protein